MSKSMKTLQPIFHVAFIVFILLITLPSEAGKKSMNITRLEHIQILAEITYDLDADTPVLFKLDKNDDSQSCLCACREGMWSCTTLECNAQGDSCMKTEWDDEETDLRAPQGFQPYSMLENLDGDINDMQ